MWVNGVWQQCGPPPNPGLVPIAMAGVALGLAGAFSAAGGAQAPMLRVTGPGQHSPAGWKEEQWRGVAHAWGEGAWARGPG